MLSESVPLIGLPVQGVVQRLESEELEWLFGSSVDRLPRIN
jgi:hypothetical protein